MDREKRVLVVNRLHQILSPFMLRRMVSHMQLALRTMSAWPVVYF
jgi:hypothetical protein